MTTHPLSEQKLAINDGSGYQMKMDKISFNQIDLKWASYICPEQKLLSFHPDKPTIVSHFRIQDPVGIISESGQRLREKQFVVYREAAEAYDLKVLPTQNKTRTFFELNISANLFEQMFTEESQFLRRFRNSTTLQTPAFDFTAQIIPGMFAVINDMQQAPYTGYLKGVYLEAKAIELFLLQIGQLDQQKSITSARLKPGDIDALHSVRDYLTANYQQPCSLTALAKRAGINQMKLKNGFKALFGTTVFGYLNELRMYEARRLLLDEKLYVSEVADRMGYQHPQHFTAAFRRKFGMLPKALRK